MENYIQRLNALRKELLDAILNIVQQNNGQCVWYNCDERDYINISLLQKWEAPIITIYNDGNFETVPKDVYVGKVYYDPDKDGLKAVVYDMEDACMIELFLDDENIFIEELVQLYEEMRHLDWRLKRVKR